ncbi:MAG: Dabb family protein [Bacteroidetes bacterium]|nr:Dabb family protein [Bacteroidota bacterium]
MFIHHVFFWLKHPARAEDLLQLQEGLQRLSSISSIRTQHIGRPASTHRDVIDASYSLSWLTTFDTAADEASYQQDPLHLEFVATCAYLWEKVVVYDSVDA